MIFAKIILCTVRNSYTKKLTQSPANKHHRTNQNDRKIVISDSTLSMRPLTFASRYASLGMSVGILPTNKVANADV